jgi:hypothetical protein
MRANRGEYGWEKGLDMVGEEETERWSEGRGPELLIGC